MNVTTPQHMDALMSDWLYCTIASVDVESNGLSIHAGHYPISLSIYFPEYDRSYNLAWAHGQGEIKTALKTDDKFHAATWQKKDKKQYYKSYWFNRLHESGIFNWGNVPQDWFYDFREAWNASVHEKTIVYYNAPFDMHMMEHVGFTPPRSTEDVRLLVSLTFEDWLYPGLVNPKTRQPIEGSNNQLKWQANFWKIEGALDGEKALAVAAQEFSTTLAEFVIDNWQDDMNTGIHKLKRAIRADELLPKLTIDPKSEMWMLPSHAVAPYAENDVVITWKLRERLLPKLEAWGQTQLYNDLCAVQGRVSVRMERNGALLDTEVATKQRAALEPMKADIKSWFSERYTPVDKHDYFAFSTEKILNVFEKFNIDVPNTQKKTLERWMDEWGKHPAIEKLMEYRKAQRASTTYLKKWIESVDDNGYIHPSFNLAGTVTGRWSSSSGVLGQMGNMQNIPSRRFEVKKAVITPAGWKMGQIDYGQIELRLAAWIANCQPMIKMFNEGEDLHAYTMEQMNVRGLLFGSLTADEIVSEVGLVVKEGDAAEASVYTYCRTLAKTCNFALLYGGTYRVLVRMLDIPAEQAMALHAAWNALYPEFAAANRYYKQLALKLRERPNGSGTGMYVQQPIGGRTRKFDLYPTFEAITDRKTGEVLFTQNTRERKAKDAFNAIVQGQATYIIAISALRICDKYGDDVFRPFAIIHDSLNFYIREDMLAILPDILAIMSDWDTNPRQSAAVELSVTGSWQDLKEYDLELLLAVSGDETEDEDEDVAA